MPLAAVLAYSYTYMQAQQNGGIGYLNIRYLSQETYIILQIRRRAVCEMWAAKLQ